MPPRAPAASRSSEPAADHVARGVDPRGRGAVVAVDDDPPAAVDLDARLGEPEALGVRRAAGGEQHRPCGSQVPSDSVTVSRPSTRAARRRPRRRSRARRARQVVRQQPRQLAIDARQQRSAWLTSVTGMPRAVKTVANSTPIGAAADDHDVRRDRPDRVDPVGVVDVGIVERDARAARVGRDPVAIRIVRAASSRVAPSGVVTTDAPFGPSRAAPWRYAMPSAASCRATTPCSRSRTCRSPLLDDRQRGERQRRPDAVDLLRPKPVR